MNRVSRIVALFAAIAVPGVALASGGGNSGGGKVYVTDCHNASYKPKVIILACGDVGAYVQKLNWSKWSSTSASATGTYTFKTCKPNCAAGGTKSFPAKVALSKPTSCPKVKKGKVFTEIAVTFPKHNLKDFSESLGCPF